jgi:hypothetical protein
MNFFRPILCEKVNAVPLLKYQSRVSVAPTATALTKNCRHLDMLFSYYVCYYEMTCIVTHITNSNEILHHDPHNIVQAVLFINSCKSC